MKKRDFQCCAQVYWVLVVAALIIMQFQNCARAEFSMAGTAEPSTSALNGIVSIAPGEGGGETITFPNPSFSKNASLNFEDLVTNSDQDYNDFITLFNIKETYDSRALTKIEIEVTPKARSASLDHRFYLILDGQPNVGRALGELVASPLVAGKVDIKIEYFTGAGVKVDTQEIQDTSEDLKIFSSTKEILGGRNKYNEDPCAANYPLPPTIKAKITITGIDPALNPRRPFNIRLYRFGIETQGNFIDLYDVNPKSLDPGQRPLGFIIPADWKAPRDAVSVFRHYPLLADYMAMIKQKFSDPTVVIPDNLIRWFDNAQGFTCN